MQGEEEPRGPLTPGERERLAAAVRAYVASSAPTEPLDVGASMLHIHAAFEVFRAMCRDSGAAASGGGAGRVQGSGGGVGGLAEGSVRQSGYGGGAESAPNKGVYALQDEAKRLRLQVQQRDNEITILVAMLKKRGGALAAPGAVAAVPPPTAAAPAAQPPAAIAAAPGAGAALAAVPAERADVAAAQASLLDVSVLKDRTAAFELFRKSYKRSAAIEDNKAELKSKYLRAKELGGRANALKAEIGDLKATLQRERLRASAATLVDTEADLATSAATAEESAAARDARARLEAAKGEYHATFDELRGHKSEIEHLQKLLEQSRDGMVVRALSSLLETYLMNRLRQRQSCLSFLLPQWRVGVFCMWYLLFHRACVLSVNKRSHPTMNGACRRTLRGGSP